MTNYKQRFIGRSMMAFALAGASTVVCAEDIDIYSGVPPANAGAPNVLIVLDSSGNWGQNFNSSTKFAAEKSALATVVSALKTQFNLGIMMYTESGGANSNTDGGYVRFAIQSMTNSDGTASDARNCLLKMVGSGTTCTSLNPYYSNLDQSTGSGDGSNSGKIGKTMNEAYNYLAGVNAYAGNNKVKADPLAFVSGTIAGPKYKAPVLGTCGKNFVIVINNGPFQDSSSDTSAATTNLTNAGGNTTVINPPDNGTSKNTVSDEWTRWLNKSSATNAITYVLEVGPTTSAQGPYTTSLMQSMGTQGTGGYYSATTAQQLLDAMNRIFNDIQATNSVFASSSLPLSADNSGAFANQIYMGVFRPDAQGKPRWVGNLKQYKFAVDTNKNLSVIDAAGLPAAGSTGFAQPDALSFWTSKDTTKAPDAAAATATNATNGSTAGFWYFAINGSGGAFDSPDGELVEKGGAAQQLRLAYLGYGGRGGIGDTNASTLNSKPARKIYTCAPSTSCVANAALNTMPFDVGSSALVTTDFGAADAAELALMVKWVRGQDTQNENNFQVGSANTDVRASIHGDVLHSRPVVLNYGTPSTSDNVYVFYGGNDGVFRAIKGGQATTDGTEQWAFIAPEFFGKLKRQYNNSPQVLYPSTAASSITPTPIKRDYFFDGPITSYVERDTSGNVTKAYLYLGMRRGGRFMYALDVTSPTNPKFLWKKSPTDTGFAELGQTWSQPVVAKIRNTTHPLVLVFGAGYDAAAEDTEPPASTDSFGRAIYVLDAITGTPVWAGGKATNFGSLPTGMAFKSVPEMDFSVAGDVLVFDRSFDGFADRVYATDVGGNLWRVDIDDTSPSNWKVWKLATLASRSAMTTTRKFLFGVDVVPGDTYDRVFVGSGDREHPLVSNQANSTINRFYMIKDTNVGLVGADLGITDTCAGTVSTSCSDLFDVSGGGSVPADASGWSIKFAAGEQVVNGPLVVLGHALFGTNKPDTSGSSCNANLGIAQRYDVALSGPGFNDVTVTSTVAAGGGFLPPVVAGTVEIDGNKYLFTLDNPLNPGGPQFKPVPSNKRSRAYWRQILD